MSSLDLYYEVIDVTEDGGIWYAKLSNKAKQQVKDITLNLIDETTHRQGHCERLKSLKSKVEAL